MKKFFSKFILKKNDSYIKLEVEKECLIFMSKNIKNFKFNEIDINNYINNSENKIQNLENKIQNLENKIQDIQPFNIQKYLEDNRLSISKGEIVVK